MQTEATYYLYTNVELKNQQYHMLHDFSICLNNKNLEK